MEVSGHEEGEIAMPINMSSSGGGTSSTCGHGNGNGNGQGQYLNIIHHHHHDHRDGGNSASQHHSHMMMMMGSEEKKEKEKVRYRECLKNHAAALGGNATDGCGEFMPSGEDGTMEALNCSACHCHRNFHRRELQAEAEAGGDMLHHASSFDYPLSSSLSPHLYYLSNRSRRGKFLMHGGGHPQHNPTSMLLPSSRAQQQQQMIMPLPPYTIGAAESEEQEGGGGGGSMNMNMNMKTTKKKRFRTKFTQEQKEKMLGFAEKVGWKIQKQEESVVQHFCQQIGVKRRVLKVWMHNNKHHHHHHHTPNNNNNNPPPTAA